MADLRKCIGSTRFGIEAHEAPVADFPVQPSQKDGLGRMCKIHWNQYATALRTAATTKVVEAEDSTAAGDATTPEPVETKPSRGKAKASKPVAESAEPAAE